MHDADGSGRRTVPVGARCDAACSIIAFPTISPLQAARHHDPTRTRRLHFLVRRPRGHPRLGRRAWKKLEISFADRRQRRCRRRLGIARQVSSCSPRASMRHSPPPPATRTSRRQPVGGGALCALRPVALRSIRVPRSAAAGSPSGHSRRMTSARLAASSLNAHPWSRPRPVAALRRASSPPARRTSSRRLAIGRSRESASRRVQ